MSVLHPRIRMPLWVAVAVPVAAYVYRSAARGFDFRPDVPLDLLVLGMYVIVLGIVFFGRRARARYEREEQGDTEDGDERDQS